MGNKPRCVSNHVGSRWYRAPEISLIEKQYDFAQDMWSIGCVLFEVLKCSKENAEYSTKNLKHRVLFPGESCFPLSPRQQLQDDSMTNVVDRTDQLFMTFKLLGPQTDDDLSFLSDKAMRSYAQNLSKGAGSKKIDFKNFFPKNSLDIVQTLDHLLYLNPHFRSSASEAL